MVIGLNALAEGLGDGFISAGNTGALLAGSIFIIKRLEDIDRAAITLLYPTIKGMSLLIDAGANMDSKPEYLRQFAIMGYIYTKEVLGKSNPTVGLINVGSEKTKGNLLSKEAFKLLESEEINFIGNIEGRDLPFGVADVMVCDGFVGNVVLKVTEGVAESIFSMLKKELTSSKKSKFGALLLKNELSNLKKALDYREYGGAPLLGIRKPVVKAHGSSDDYAIKNGINQLIRYIDKDIIKIIESQL
jgi:glycerol-3-phosphate acyltransferase PlsX